MTDSSNPSSESSPSRWRFLRHFRLRWTSLFVLVVMTASMSLINVRGAFVQYPSVKLTGWSHGWPYEYMQRSHGTFLPPGLNVRSFSYYYLAVDVLIGLVIVLLVVIPCEAWRRRRGRYRFSILDIIVLMTLVSLLLGRWKTCEAARVMETRIVEKCLIAHVRLSADSGAVCRSKNVAPEWLIRLTDNSKYFQHNRLSIIEFFNEEIFRLESFQRFRELVYLREVRCRFGINKETIEALATLPSLRILHTDSVTKSNTIERELPQDDLTTIAKLDQLEVLTLTSNKLLIEDLSPLDDSHSLKKIHLQIMATEEELKAYQETRPHLKITWRGVQPKASIEALRAKKLAEGE